MASRYGGITGTEQIANDYQNINIAFENVEADVDAKAAIVTDHINSTAAHAAEHITYSGSAAGDNVKDAIDTIDERIDTIIQGGGPDKDAELVDIRTPDPSYTPSRTINVAGDIVRDMQAQFSAQLADTAIIPKIIAPEANYDNALIRVHDAVQPGGIIFIPQGQVIEFTTWTITKQDIRITGGGILKGKIVIRTSDTTDYYSGVSLENLIFDSTGVAIELKRGDGIRIINNTFKNNDKSILIQSEAQDYDDIHHCVGSVIISDNYFKLVNYMVYIQALDEVKNLPNFDIWKVCGDVTISNNHAKPAMICHIYADIIDGLVVDGNTLFHYGSASKVATKTYCVYVGTWGSQLVVTNNELFEPGLEAVYLFDCQNVIIDANNIVQPGQVNLRSGIKLDYSGTGDDVPGTNTAFAVITNNVIYSPSKYGIELKNQSYGYASGNFIFNPSESYAYYGTDFGNPAMNTVTHYGVYVEGDAGVSPFKITADNYTTVNGLARNHNYNYYPSNEGSHIDITDPATTQLPCSYKIVNLNPSAAMTITDIVNGFEGQELTILSFNGNATIQNNSKIRLLNAVDYTMPSFSSLRLQYYGGWWIEVARTKLTA